MRAFIGVAIFVTLVAATGGYLKERGPQTTVDRSDPNIQAIDVNSLFTVALEKGKERGLSFATMSASYTRLLTTLLTLGFNEQETNLLIPYFAEKKGLVLNSNAALTQGVPENALPLPWALNLSPDGELLRDYAALNGKTFEQYLSEAGVYEIETNTVLRDQNDMSAVELKQQLGLPFSSSLREIVENFAELRKERKQWERTDGLGAQEYESALRDAVYDYQNEKNLASCGDFSSEFAAYWSASRPRFDGSDIDNGNYKSALESATELALWRVQRRKRLVVIGGDAAELLPLPLVAFFSGDRVPFKHIEIVDYDTPDLERHPAITPFLEAAQRESTAIVSLSSEDVASMVCAVAFSVRRVVFGASDVNDAVQHLRSTFNHFYATVQHQSPTRIIALQDADVVVVNMAIHRLPVPLLRFAYDLMIRRFGQEIVQKELALGDEGFDHFYRTMYEELSFFSSATAQRVVRTLAVEVPEGAAIVLAFPVKECRETQFRNGSTVEEYCLGYADSLGLYSQALSREPIQTWSTKFRWTLTSDVTNAPRDTNTKSLPVNVPKSPEEERVQRPEDIIRETSVSHVRIAVFQRGEPRPAQDPDDVPFFGDDVEAMIRAEEAEEDRMAQPRNPEVLPTDDL